MATATLRISEVSAKQRIATLDGWRGVAILLVLVQHAAERTRYENYPWACLGTLGVYLFFALSGYIITARLAEERVQTGTISLRHFYVRRAFRILPLVLLYLTVVCLLSLVLPMGIQPREVVASLLFFRNYQYSAHPGGIYTTHFWSLSIEEHFYLLWPALLLGWGDRRALWMALAGAGTCALWRSYDQTHPLALLPGATPALRSLRTDCMVDGLLLGATLALALAHPAVRGFVQRNVPKETPLVLACLLMLDLQRTRSMPALSTFLLLTLIVGSTLTVEEGLAHKWLNFRPLVWIGTISYSLYIWQQIFLLHHTGLFPLGRLSMFPINIACAFVVATCSYYLIERPAIAFGKRLYARNVYAPPPADGAAMVTENA